MSSPGNQPDDKSLEEKLADALTKCLVLGGGGYGLYNLYRVVPEKPQIRLFLQDVLQYPVDVGTEDALKEHLRQPILEGKIRVF